MMSRAKWGVCLGISLLQGCVIILPDGEGGDGAWEDSGDADEGLTVATSAESTGFGESTSVGDSTSADEGYESSSSSSGFETSDSVDGEVTTSFEEGFDTFVSATGEEGFDTGFESGYETGFDTGFETATSGEEGFDTGFETADTGFETADTGFETADTGFETGFETGYETGFDTGFDTGESGFDTGFDTGEEGFTTVFDTGEEGFDTGFESSSGYEETTSGEESGGDTEGFCELPPLHPRRSLIETNPQALADIDMSQLLFASAVGADLSPDPVFTFTRLFDSFATEAGGASLGGAHCDDKLTNGQPSLNGYPLDCPRIESEQVGHIDEWFPIAAVNRFDLAPVDGSHCGEQRIIMASNANGRAFAIFEAQIPNPSPECGLAACLPIVDFWANLGQMSDPAQRATELRMAFLDGHVDLLAAGFEPFMTSVNMTFGTGQIRTNSFDDDPWTLREFSFVTEAGRLSVVPSPVADSAVAGLWNDLDPLPKGPQCRQAILDNLPSLLSDNVSIMGLPLPVDCHAAESRDDETTDYAAELAAGSGAFETAIAQRLDELGSDLSPLEVANRAEFASNCMGCHQSGTGEELGHGVFAPFSNGFVHVDESFLDSCGGGQECFTISQALSEEFLPHRLDVANEFLAGLVDCEATCEGGNVDAVSALLGGPASIGLPSAEQPVSELLAWEAELTANLATQTIGGRPRGSH